MTPAPTVQHPPAALCAAAIAHVGDVPVANWQVLTGGRTNRLWRVGTRVVKLYDPALETPLFPNDPVAEFAAMTHLAPSGLAPKPVARLSGSFGEALVYDYLDGPTGFSDLPGLARMLHRVHGQTAPTGLRSCAGGSGAILDRADRLISLTRNPTPELTALRARLSDLPPVPPTTPTLIHADPVAANVVMTGGGPVLIDWQCPAIGDPCEDLAIVLSPSMQQAYGAPLTPAQQAEFLDAYPDKARVARTRALAPFHHVMMAAYAVWSRENGRDYGATAGAQFGADAENGAEAKQEAGARDGIKEGAEAGGGTLTKDGTEVNGGTETRDAAEATELAAARAALSQAQT